MEVRPFLVPRSAGRPRAAVFLSGTGTNAEKILAHRQRAGSAASFDVAVLVTDAPETSRAREIGQAYGLPVVANDIRAFYRRAGETRVSIATETGRRLREEWTQALREQIAPLGVDFGVLAGFVPLTNLTGDFPCLNVHPGDLTYLEDGRRYLVGLHTVPVERAILRGLPCLRTSVIIAQPYTGRGDDMDNGPVLGVSAPVPVDLQGATHEELAAAAAARSPQRPRGGYGDRLETVAQHNLQLLKEGGDWVVFPPVVQDFAAGRFGAATDGQLGYRCGDRWYPVRTVVYDGVGREIVFPAGEPDGPQGNASEPGT